jgi:hypothetical protein
VAPGGVKDRRGDDGALYSGGAAPPQVLRRRPNLDSTASSLARHDRPFRSGHQHCAGPIIELCHGLRRVCGLRFAGERFRVSLDLAQRTRLGKRALPQVPVCCRRAGPLGQPFA